MPTTRYLEALNAHTYKDAMSQIGCWTRARVHWQSQPILTEKEYSYIILFSKIADDLHWFFSFIYIASFTLMTEMASAIEF